MAKCFERMKRNRTINSSTTRLITRIEEVSKDVTDCDRLCEMLSVLSTKEENLMDKGIEDETLTDELEAELAQTHDY